MREWAGKQGLFVKEDKGGNRWLASSLPCDESQQDLFIIRHLGPSVMTCVDWLIRAGTDGPPGPGDVDNISFACHNEISEGRMCIAAVQEMRRGLGGEGLGCFHCGCRSVILQLPTHKSTPMNLVFLGGYLSFFFTYRNKETDASLGGH